ncbi:MAG: nucleotidyltransferase family protein [Cyanosarcina radialis HA8281-LM2]|jgi:hypothetical protein|nr:nucleotidyltransferase family protein [Cyanosarcina radialis HA8281-LM2]
MKLEELKAYRQEILTLAQKYHAPNIRVFGSVARGEATAESDVDFSIDVSPKQSLLDLIGLLQDLKELLECEVDVAQSTVLHPVILDRVLKEAIPL